MRPAHARPAGDAGFTLLEVILALAVLAVSLAIVGEANTQADRNAQRAALESDATLLAESVLAELVSGVRQPVSVEAEAWSDGAPDGGSAAVAWTFSIAVEPAPHDRLLAVRVAMQEAEPIAGEPVRVVLDRWLIDPDAVEQLQNQADANEEAGV